MTNFMEEKRMKPDLKITTQNGVKSVEVNYDRGDQEAAFELLRRALPALEQLDDCTRQTTGTAS